MWWIALYLLLLSIGAGLLLLYFIEQNGDISSLMNQFIK